MHKSERQQKIIDLIGSAPITTQADLASKLSTLGFHVTQASVSRDIDELGIVKVNGAYSMPLQKTTSGLAPYSLEISGETLIVAKCTPGLASAIAVKIDAADIGEIVGTIAGDDTIFIAVADHKAQKTAIKAIRRLFENE